MFRAKVASTLVNHHECKNCTSTIVCIISPQYPRVEEFIDDLIDMRIGIIKMIKKKLSDSDVYEWLLDKADSNFGAQFTNGISTLFLLKDLNAIDRIHRLLEQHNIVSQKICGKKCLYSSPDIIEAFRDARIFFPKDINESELLVEATRAYAASHLTEALASELAAHQVAELKGQKVIHLL